MHNVCPTCGRCPTCGAVYAPYVVTTPGVQFPYTVTPPTVTVGAVGDEGTVPLTVGDALKMT